MRAINYIIIFAVALLAACKGSDSGIDDAGKSIEMKYAEFLTMKQGNGFITAEVLDPWHQGKVLHRYVLVRKDDKVNEDSLPNGDVIRIPVEKAAVYTSVHCGLLDELGAYNNIKGVCDLEYINMPRLQQDVKAGKVVDLGNSMTPDIEKIIDLHPDVIMLSPFENSGSYGKLGSLSGEGGGKGRISLIECADYMETSALGRAEWIRFYGLLMGEEGRADSIFAAVEEAYNGLCDSVKTTKHRPTVLTESKIGSTWYVAGGNSYVGKILKDAGADYIFKDEKNTGAAPYDPEVVFDRGQQADYWLLKYSQQTPLTYTQMAQDWGNNAQMKAFKMHKVFGCNLTTTHFYEETPFHPDILLRDYVAIFHPELLKGYKMRYYQPVQ